MPWFLEPYIFPAIFVAVTFGVIGAGRLYGKRHGRAFPENVTALSNTREPFVEPRLNEPFKLIRKIRPTIAILSIGGAIVAAVDFREMAIFYTLLGVGCFVIVSKRLFVEACIAFGAETVPVPERHGTRAPLPRT